MKRLLLAFVTLLTGCYDNSLTDEMLVGNWNCDEAIYEAKFENDTFSDYKKVKGWLYSIQYVYEDGKFYKKQDDNPWEEFSLSDAMKNEPNQNQDDEYYRSISKISVNKISNDKFSITEESEFVMKNKKHNPDGKYNNKAKSQLICTRIPINQ